jgi:hypothetical protein
MLGATLVRLEVIAMSRRLALVALAIALNACQPGNPASSSSPATTASPGASSAPAASAAPSASVAPSAGPSAPASIAPGVTTYFDGTPHLDSNTVAKYQGTGLMIHGKTNSGRYPESTLTLTGVGEKPLLAGFKVANVASVSIFVNGTQLRPSFNGNASALTLVSTTGRLVGVVEGQTTGQNAAGTVNGPKVRMAFNLDMPLAPAP